MGRESSTNVVRLTESDTSSSPSADTSQSGWRDAPQRAFTQFAHASAKQKLHYFLTERPAGADAHELLGLLFCGAGSDHELGARIIEGIIGGDPNFAFEPESGLWSLARAASLRIPLEEASFVVVDLETAAGRPAPGSIIEIGAYRMRGRQLVDSFESLVRPRVQIPRFVAGLTSISDETVAAAPPIEEVLPRFRAFLGDAVMVAHNAQFDRAFLDYEFRRLFGIGLLNPVLCTLRMSRSLLPTLKRRRLDLLAEHFGLSTAGRHRGLGDARMAAELLSIFLEMVQAAGLNRLDRLLDRHARGPTGRRLERHVPPEAIAALPRSPGVYLMRNQRGDLLYVGKAARLRDRVASYFNAGAGLNAKTAELVCHVWAIETRSSRSALEAALLEARLIRELKPPYNRMLKAAAPAYFIRVDLNDPLPRLRAVQKLSAKPRMLQLGPFIGRRNIDHSLRALSRLLGLRTCSGHLEPSEDFSPCIYGQMGHCAAPCNLQISEEAYNDRIRRAITFLRGRSGPLLGELARARDQAASAMRFEEARRHHRDLEALATLAERATRLSQVVTENNLVIVVRGEYASQPCPAAYVVLSGRLALVRDLDSPHAAFEIARFIADNYKLYQLKPVLRSELEAMMAVARWLKERDPADGEITTLASPLFDPNCLNLDFDYSQKDTNHASQGK
ncbi:MAG TPA: exonuclease domain-containing protein [Candidatus Binataceae bacterium]|nr:exonuclease domain-containing protein [Candidatus Binataceae bacterium]